MFCPSDQPNPWGISDDKSSAIRSSPGMGDNDDVTMEHAHPLAYGRANHSRTPSFGMEIESHSRNNSWNSATNHRADLENFQLPETPRDAEMEVVGKNSNTSPHSSTHSHSHSQHQHQHHQHHQPTLGHPPPYPFDNKFFNGIVGHPAFARQTDFAFPTPVLASGPNGHILSLQGNRRMDETSVHNLSDSSGFSFPQTSPGSLHLNNSLDSMSLNPSESSNSQGHGQNSPFGFLAAGFPNASFSSGSRYPPASHGMGASMPLVPPPSLGLPPLDQGSPSSNPGSSRGTPQPPSGNVFPSGLDVPSNSMSHSRSTSPHSNPNSVGSAGSSGSYSPFPTATAFAFSASNTPLPHRRGAGKNASALGELQSTPFKREAKRRRYERNVSRKKTNVACTNCVRAKAGCDTQRPCSRCIRLGKEEMCRDRNVKASKRSKKRKTSHSPEPQKTAAELRQDYQHNLEKKKLTDRIARRYDQIREEGNVGKEQLVEEIINTIMSSQHPGFNETKPYENVTAELFSHQFRRSLSGYSVVGLQLICSLLGQMVHPNSSMHAQSFANNLLSLVTACHETFRAQPAQLQFKVIDNNSDSCDLKLEFRASEKQWICVVICSTRVWQLTNQEPIKLLSHLFFDEAGWASLIEKMLAVVGFTTMSQFPIQMCHQGQQCAAEGEIYVADIAPDMRALRSFTVRLR